MIELRLTRSRQLADASDCDSWIGYPLPNSSRQVLAGSPLSPSGPTGRTSCNHQYQYSKDPLRYKREPMGRTASRSDNDLRVESFI